MNQNSVYRIPMRTARWRNFILAMTSGYNFMVKFVIVMLLSVVVVSTSHKNIWQGLLYPLIASGLTFTAIRIVTVL